MEKPIRYKSRREKERDELKNTAGYKAWMVMFTLFYPFIAVFTFLFSGIVLVFSTISRGITYLIGKLFIRS